MKIDVVRTYFTREFTKGIMFVDDVSQNVLIADKMMLKNNVTEVN